MQKVELKASKVLHVGPCDNSANHYPLAKKKQSFEFLREIAHLRPRSNTIGAVARIRNALATATHTFFQNNGFLYVHTPIITCSDCEGAGEMFQVTTLLGKIKEEEASPKLSPQELEALQGEVAAQGDKVKQLKEEAAADKSNKGLASSVKKEVALLLKLKEDLAKAEERRRLMLLVKAFPLVGPIPEAVQRAADLRRARVEGGIPRLAGGEVDYGKDFFSKPAFLTVSGQLNAEYFACALRTSTLSFWMIEPEIAFATLQDVMQCAEDYVQFCCNFLLQNCSGSDSTGCRCRADLEFIAKVIDPAAVERLKAVGSTPFKRLSYTDAIQILQDVVASKKKKFEFKVCATTQRDIPSRIHGSQRGVNPLEKVKVEWGCDLQSEHERYLTEEVFKQPVIVYDYPAGIKAFYMRLNDDGKTVAAMDVLVPKVGELIGGSQREERLERRIVESGMPLEPYRGYLDLRRYGTVPHGGFGLGFERLILFATGLENIRETIPFPRWPGHADY
eukprot:jgi/Botrbrau1/714/Bobra.160_2s0037.1